LGVWGNHWRSKSCKSAQHSKTRLQRIKEPGLPDLPFDEVPGKSYYSDHKDDLQIVSLNGGDNEAYTRAIETTL
jgi:hypothetical protein